MKAFKTLAICSLFCLWNGCNTPPTEVEAWRNKIGEDPPPVNTSAIKFASKHLDFGYYLVQTGSDFVEMPIYNISMIDTVRIDSLTFKNGNRYFKAAVQGNGYPIPLLPGQRTTTEKKINIQFYPQTAGEFFDTLYVNGDTSNYVALHGISGTYIESASNTITPDPLDFSNVTVGSSKELTTQIKNTDNIPLKLSIEKLPPDETAFSIRTLPGEYVIAPGDFKDISIVFSPMEVKDYTEEIRFYLRGATGKLQTTITAKGKGTP